MRWRTYFKEVFTKNVESLQFFFYVLFCGKTNTKSVLNDPDWFITEPDWAADPFFVRENESIW